MKTADDWWKERGGRVWLEDLRTEPAVVDVEAIRVIQRDARAELKAENERLRDFIDREGYRRCDCPACNCDSFHGGHAHTRLSEIYEALGGCDGTTALREVRRLREALAAAEKVVEAARVYTSDFECDFFAAYDKLKEGK